MEEFAKLFSWPVVSLIFAAVFIILFRSPINTFISRIRSAGKDGVRLDASPDAQGEKQKSEIVQELMDVGSSEVREEVEAIIKNELKAKNLETEGDTIKILIRHLAATQMALDFEQVYSLIYGSQIFLLKKLNEVSGQGKPRSYVENHYQEVKKLYPEFYQNWDINNYLDFLLSRTLVITHGEQYHITKKGQEFIVWLARIGRREDVPY